MKILSVHLRTFIKCYIAESSLRNQGKKEVLLVTINITRPKSSFTYTKLIFFIYSKYLLVLLPGVECVSCLCIYFGTESTALSNTCQIM